MIPRDVRRLMDNVVIPSSNTVISDPCPTEERLIYSPDTNTNGAESKKAIEWEPNTI